MKIGMTTLEPRSAVHLSEGLPVLALPYLPKRGSTAPEGPWSAGKSHLGSVITDFKAQKGVS